MNAERKHCRLSEFLGSSSALTDCFTCFQSLIDPIRHIRQLRAKACERGILAHSRLAFTRSERITRLRNLAGRQNRYHTTP